MDAEIKDGMGLVRFVIKKFYPMHLNDDDYIQEGMIGLWKALQKYDASRGAKFSTFAVICIRSEIGKYLRRELRRPPTYSLDFLIYEDGDFTLGDTIYSDSDLFEDRLLNEVDANRDLHHLEQNLSEISNKVLYHRLGEKSQREIAEELGVSRTKVFNEMKLIRKKYGHLSESRSMALASSQ